jgi:hypothetical protein
VASPILNASAVLMCPHGGRCQPVTPSARVKINGSPCLVTGTPMPIVGCVVPPNSAPCITGQAVAGSARVRSMGQAVLTVSSPLLATPSGMPITVASAGQARVNAV